MTPIKWFAATIGVVIGVSHIGMIGMIANRKDGKLPDLDIPVGPYTSYVVSADKRDTRSVILLTIPRQRT